ncbi:MAG TPA: ribosomal L7Ae/L30e/S12e/Gadd45 family protein [Verrucomicrobiae bacterium]|nr:ribosomal L7Ae/L30e/S12e/Gadd45 family protein [Verrucomicrobiae bacterium]
MQLERLKAAKHKTVGLKQTLKALEKGLVKIVFLADDAEPHVTKPLQKLCSEKAVPIEQVLTMEDLGKACGIEVGAATAAILEE